MVALLRTGPRPWVEYAEMVEERGSAAAVLEDELAGAAAPAQQTTLFSDPEDAHAAEDRTARTGTSFSTRPAADIERWRAQACGCSPFSIRTIRRI